MWPTKSTPGWFDPKMYASASTKFSELPASCSEAAKAGVDSCRESSDSKPLKKLTKPDARWRWILRSIGRAVVERASDYGEVQLPADPARLYPQCGANV